MFVQADSIRYKTRPKICPKMRYPKLIFYQIGQTYWLQSFNSISQFKIHHSYTGPSNANVSYFVMPLYFTPRFPKVRPPRKVEETCMARSLKPFNKLSLFQVALRVYVCRKQEQCPICGPTSGSTQNDRITKCINTVTEYWKLAEASLPENTTSSS